MLVNAQGSDRILVSFKEDQVMLNSMAVED